MGLVELFCTSALPTADTEAANARSDERMKRMMQSGERITSVDGTSGTLGYLCAEVFLGF
jgi:hypothetical protein